MEPIDDFIVVVRRLIYDNDNDDDDIENKRLNIDDDGIILYIGIRKREKGY